MSATSWRGRLVRFARAVTRSPRSFPDRQSRVPTPAPPAPHAAAPPYAGDLEGVPAVSYDPRDDGHPDPGEVVWAWVPYEEDHSRGKDRPVLVIGRDGDHLLALAFTSKDHDRDEAQEASAGRFWFDLGAGAWDRSGRPSEVRLDRVLRLEVAAVRREGATLDRERFEAMAAELRRLGGDR